MRARAYALQRELVKQSKAMECRPATLSRNPEISDDSEVMVNAFFRLNMILPRGRCGLTCMKACCALHVVEKSMVCGLERGEAV